MIVIKSLLIDQGHSTESGAEVQHQFQCQLGCYRAFKLENHKYLYQVTVTISHQSLKEGFKNYLFTTLPVWHRPHGSRPWKQLKYKNPLKYYWLKYTKGLDKI